MYTLYKPFPLTRSVILHCMVHSFVLNTELLPDTHYVMIVFILVYGQQTLETELWSKWGTENI